MTHEEVQEYFKTYIEPYKPYEGDPFYDRLVEYLIVYYTEHTYDTIPEPFKVAFETQITPVEFYEPLLLSNGFTQEVLDKLTFSAKSTLVQSFMDFQRAKGSIRLLKKVAREFDENYNIYELYIHRTTDDTDWCFIPHPIFLADEENKVDSVLAFDETYNKIPRFFVNREQLDALYADNDLILPVKTNILFMDYTKVYKESTLNNLYASIVLKEFRSKRLTIYFNDGQYVISFENFWKLWYYIVLKVYGLGIMSSPITDLVSFHIDHPGFIYGTQDIDIIQAEYDNLSLRTDDVTKWYDERIASIFKIHDTPASYTLEEIEILYRECMGDSIIDYVNGRVGEVLRKEKASQILDELYNSVITWSFLTDDPKVKKYVHHAVDTLPLLSIVPENTPTYILVDFIKPYHVELLTKAAAVVRINDKFNSMYPGDIYKLFIEMVEASIFSLTHDYDLHLVMNVNTNYKPINDANTKYIKKLHDDLMVLKDKAGLVVSIETAVVNKQSHTSNSDFRMEVNTNNKIINTEAKLAFDILYEELVEIQDKIGKLSVELRSHSINEVNHHTMSNLSLDSNDNNIITDKPEQNIVRTYDQVSGITEHVGPQNVRYENASTATQSHVFNLITV